jgi:hypothetical protein
MRERFALVVDDTALHATEQLGRQLAALGTFSPRSFSLEEAKVEFRLRPEDYDVVIINDDITAHHSGRDWADHLAMTTTKMVILLAEDSQLRHYRRVIMMPKKIQRDWFFRVVTMMHELDT